MANQRPKYSKEKYEDMLKSVISLALRQDLADPRFTMMSVLEVKLNKDFSVAKVYWDTFDAKLRGDIKAALDGVKGKMRTHVANNLKLRHAPIINFFYNSQYEDEHKITTLLSENDEEE